MVVLQRIPSQGEKRKRGPSIHQSHKINAFFYQNYGYSVCIALTSYTVCVLYLGFLAIVFTRLIIRFVLFLQRAFRIGIGMIIFTLWRA